MRTEVKEALDKVKNEYVASLGLTHEVDKFMRSNVSINTELSKLSDDGKTYITPIGKELKPIDVTDEEFAEICKTAHLLASVANCNTAKIAAETASTLNKIHFWVKLWSILTLAGAALWIILLLMDL